MFKKFCKVKKALGNENNRLLLLVYTSTGPGGDIHGLFQKDAKKFSI